MTVDKIVPPRPRTSTTARGFQRAGRRQPRAPDRRQRRGLPHRGRDPRDRRSGVPGRGRDRRQILADPTTTTSTSTTPSTPTARSAASCTARASKPEGKGPRARAVRGPDRARTPRPTRVGAVWHLGGGHWRPMDPIEEICARGGRARRRGRPPGDLAVAPGLHRAKSPSSRTNRLPAPTHCAGCSRTQQASSARWTRSTSPAAASTSSSRRCSRPACRSQTTGTATSGSRTSRPRTRHGKRVLRLPRPAGRPVPRPERRAFPARGLQALHPAARARSSKTSTRTACTTSRARIPASSRTPKPSGAAPKAMRNFAEPSTTTSRSSTCAIRHRHGLLLGPPRPANRAPPPRRRAALRLPQPPPAAARALQPSMNSSARRSISRASCQASSRRSHSRSTPTGLKPTAA